MQANDWCAIGRDSQGRTFASFPRQTDAEREANQLPAFLRVIHHVNAASHDSRGTCPFGTPRLTSLHRVPEYGHDNEQEGSCEWYPDFRVEHLRGQGRVRIVARTAAAGELLADAYASVLRPQVYACHDALEWRTDC